MSVIGSLEIVLSATTGKLAQGFKKAEGLTKSFSDKASKLVAGSGGIGGAIAGAIGGVSIAAGIKYALDQFSELEQAQTRLQSALKASGGQAGVTVGQVSALAKQLSTTTGFAASATTQAAASLAKFSQIKGGVFTETLKQAQNYAKVMGKDLPGATAELGHALQNPAEGYLELAKAGVQFSDSQIDAIQKAQSMGDVATAQGIILDALKEQMGSAAEEAGGTLSGSFDKLQNAFSNVASIVGEALAPAIKLAVGMVTEWVSGLDSAKSKSGIFEFTASAVGFIADAVQVLGIGWKAAQLAASVMVYGTVKLVSVLVSGIEDAMNALRKLAGLGKMSIGAKSLDEFAQGAKIAADQAGKDLEKAWLAPDAHHAVDQFFGQARQKSDDAMKGITDGAKAAGDAIKKGPVDAMKQLSDRAIQAQGEATQLMRTLAESIKYHGQDNYAAQAGKLADKGATKGQVDAVKKLGAILQGKDLAMSLENPLEKFQREMKKLADLQAAGGIDPETFKRAQTKLVTDLQQAAPQQKISAGGPLAQGSQEARSALLNFRQATRNADPRNAQAKIMDQQLEQAKQANIWLRELVRAQPAVAAFAGL